METGRQRLRWMLELGVTTVECKSGYGLDLETELKQLEAVRILQRSSPWSWCPPFGAHAWPPEYAGDHEGFVEFLLDTVLPAVKEQGVAEYVDVFTEKEFFRGAEPPDPPKGAGTWLQAENARG